MSGHRCERLGPREVRLVRASLDVPERELDRLRRHLSPDELLRAADYRCARDAARFIAGRGMLREILAQQVDRAPRDLPIEALAGGKPWLDLPRHLEAPVFNVAHSGPLVLFVIGRCASLGIDVEQVRPMQDREMRELAARHFSPRHAAKLRRLPDERRTRAFFRLWTRLEARVKATGEGLAGRPARPPRTELPNYWTLLELRPARGFVGTLAVPVDVRIVGRRTWPAAGGAERVSKLRNIGRDGGVARAAHRRRRRDAPVMVGSQ